MLDRMKIPCKERVEESAPAVKHILRKAKVQNVWVKMKSLTNKTHYPAFLDVEVS